MDRTELLIKLDENGKKIREERKRLSDLQFDRAKIYEGYLMDFMASYGVTEGDYIRIRFSRDDVEFREVEGFFRGLDYSNAKVHDTMVSDCKPVLRKAKTTGIESRANVGYSLTPFVSEITDVQLIAKGKR